MISSCYCSYPLLSGQILLGLLDLIAQRRLLRVQRLQLGANGAHRIAGRGQIHGRFVAADRAVVVPCGRIIASDWQRWQVLCL